MPAVYPAATEDSGMENDLLTVAEVSERLRTSDRTLRRWRELGIGPPFIRIGQRYIRYRRDAVEAWLAAQEREKEDQS
jgi:excisionase family DNA binding protein